MAIKLKPEHVGTRVLLSDGEVGFVASHDAQANGQMPPREGER